MKGSLIAAACALALAAAAAGCRAPATTTTTTSNATSTGEEITRIRLPMGYIANVQYAPYYVAAEKGYFKEEGIEVEFDYKFETDGVKLVAAGELPFAVASGEQAILARSQGLPVKYVAQWYRKFPIAVFSLAARGIKTPQDLKGKTVGLPGFFGATYVGWRAFLEVNGLSETDVNQQQIGFTQAAAVQSGQVDAAVGYVNNEPLVLAQNGYTVTVFPVAEQVDMVANGVLTSEKVIRENPQLVRGFVKALLKGIADTIEDPAEALEIAAKYVEGLKADDPVQRKVLEATVELLKGGRLGESTAQAWENTQETLLSMRQVQQKRDVSEFYTNEFLP
jgi:NitT/TauT family transport system substrate-binding protein